MYTLWLHYTKSDCGLFTHSDVTYHTCLEASASGTRMALPPVACTTGTAVCTTGAIYVPQVSPDLHHQMATVGPPLANEISERSPEVSFLNDPNPVLYNVSRSC